MREERVLFANASELFYRQINFRTRGMLVKDVARFPCPSHMSELTVTTFWKSAASENGRRFARWPKITQSPDE